jgi:hypothetical protein
LVFAEGEKGAVLADPTRGQSSTRLGHVIDDVKTLVDIFSIRLSTLTDVSSGKEQ